MTDKSGTSETSIFSSLLAVAFIVLKLTGVIDWSWWWVLSPLWITLALGLLGLYASLESRFGEGAHPDTMTRSQASQALDGLKALEKQQEAGS